MTANADDDADLARAAQAGSRAAFASLARRHERSLLRFLRLRTGSAEDAEDLLQDALVRCWQQLHRFDASRPFGTWLYTLAARLASSQRRRRAPGTSTQADEPVAPGHDPADLVARRDEHENLWDLAERLLSDDQRSALWLFYAEGRSNQEVALILGKREPAVRVILFRARAKLAENLGTEVTTVSGTDSK